MRSEFIINLRKYTFNKSNYFSEEVKNLYVSRSILAKTPKELKLFLIFDEPLDGATELKLTSITQNYAVFNSAFITGLYVSKSVLPREIPLSIGIKLEEIQ